LCPTFDIRQVDEFDAPRRRRQLQPRNRDGQPKTPGTGTSRVQVHDSGTFGAARPVRVPADDDVELGGSRIEVKLLNIVQDEY
jgi:hypothetical protein